MSEDILQFNASELKQKILELKKRISEMRFEKTAGKLIDTSAPAKSRKQLARFLTRLNQVTRKGIL